MFETLYNILDLKLSENGISPFLKIFGHTNFNFPFFVYVATNSHKGKHVNT